MTKETSESLIPPPTTSPPPVSKSDFNPHPYILRSKLTPKNFLKFLRGKAIDNFIHQGSDPHPNFYHDLSKIALLYANLHYMASLHPEERILVRITDDKRNILDDLFNFYHEHRELLPPNVKIQFYQYELEEKAHPHLLNTLTPCGATKIDYHYRKTILFMPTIVANAKNLAIHGEIFDFYQALQDNSKYQKLSQSRENRLQDFPERNSQDFWLLDGQPAPTKTQNRDLISGSGDQALLDPIKSSSPSTASTLLLTKNVAIGSALILGGVIIGGISILALLKSLGLSLPFSLFGLKIAGSMLATGLSCLGVAVAIGCVAGGTYTAMRDKIMPPANLTLPVAP